jgi:hypothetical protein
MEPEPGKHVIVLDGDRNTHQDALEDLCDVSQVERVVELSWNWEKVLGDLKIHIDCGGDCDSRLSTSDCLTKVLLFQEPVEDALEDKGKCLFLGVGNVEHHEVAHEARSELCSTSTWRSSCAHD